MCFTDFVPDPEVRYDIGWYYIGISSFMILVHLVLILYSTLKRLRLVYKKYYIRWMNKRKKVAKNPITKEQEADQVISIFGQSIVIKAPA